MTQPIRPFNIMAKPVSGVCNLACQYCYYRDKPATLYPETDKFQMPDEVLEAFTSQYIEAMPKQVDFNWQGGEPLLAGLEFFERAVELQKKYQKPDQKITNALQTNAVLLDDPWCEFIAGEGFLVGISLDGPAQWHDSFRLDHAGDGSFARAWAGMQRLTAAGGECNILVTLNSTNAPHGGDIYRYFVNRGIQYLQFIPILERDENGKPTDYSVTPAQFSQFLLDVFDQWSSRDAGRVSERFIDNAIHTLLFGQASTCCYAQRCANAHVLEFNGDLYACDHFVEKPWLIGNIMDRPLAALLADEKLTEFARLKTDLPADCVDCEFLAFCNGGCPKHHMPIGTDPARKNYYCEAYKTFFAEALETLKGMAEYFRKGQRPPLRNASADKSAAKPAVAAGAGSVQAKKPKRNEPCSCGSGRKFKSCCGK